MELGHALVIFQSLILISAANGAPVLFARLLGTRFARPIDGGVVLRDGHPLLGGSKTWRGLAAAIVLATCAAVIIGLPWLAGAITGASAMAGDCLSSFRQAENGPRAEQHVDKVSIRFRNRCYPRSPPAFIYRSVSPTSSRSSWYSRSECW